MNVSFKKGTQQALNTLQSYSAGAFYLTEDTNRLYFAQSSNELVELNQFIHRYTGTALPSSDDLAPGDFYYWTNNNILMVYDGSTWTQVNPDTKVSSFTTTVNDTSSDSLNQVTLIGQIGQQRVDGGTVATVTSQASPINIVAGTNIHLNVVDGKLQISADNDTTNTTYDLGTQASQSSGIIRLAGTDESNDDITINGVGDVEVISDANGAITITSQDPIASINNNINPENGQFITTLAFDGSTGHAAGTQAKQSSAIVPTVQYGSVVTEDPETHAETVSYANSAIFNSTTSGGDPALNLDVYSRSQIDQMLQEQFSGFDAMQYKGTVINSDAATKLNPANAQAGDTYKAAGDIELTGTLTLSAKAGDLIIASGSDGDVTWEVVPSGDEQIVTMTTTIASNLVQFTDTKPSNPATIGGIQIYGDTSSTDKANIKVTTSNVATGNISQFYLEHGPAGAGQAATWTDIASGTTQSAGNTIDIPTITGINIDKNGHVSSVTTAKYRIVDTHASLENVAVSYTSTDNVGTATIGLKLDTDSQQKVANVAITSDNLTVSTVSAEGGLKINLEWGTF